MMNTDSIPHPSQDRTAEMTTSRRTILDQYLGEFAPKNIPAQIVFEEKPHHITLAYLLAAGRTRTECAQVLDMTLQTISTVFRQPFFQKRLKEITEASGKDMVKSFLENEVLPSLETLRSIRDDADQKGPTRVLASNSILDRFLGKPMVHVESKTNLNIHTAADTVEQVQRELSSINEELTARGVSLTTGKN